jgi:hypothetical protein
MHLLTLLNETTAVYPENHKKPINTPCGQTKELLIIKAGVRACARAYVYTHTHTPMYFKMLKQ